jgi:hypothetical protein
LESEAVTRNNYAKGDFISGVDWKPDDNRGEIVVMDKSE